MEAKKVKILKWVKTKEKDISFVKFALGYFDVYV